MYQIKYTGKLKIIKMKVVFVFGFFKLLDKIQICGVIAYRIIESITLLLNKLSLNSSAAALCCTMTALLA